MMRVIIIVLSLCIITYSTVASAANAGDMEGLNQDPGSYKYCKDN